MMSTQHTELRHQSTSFLSLTVECIINYGPLRSLSTLLNKPVWLKLPSQRLSVPTEYWPRAAHLLLSFYKYYPMLSLRTHKSSDQHYRTQQLWRRTKRRSTLGLGSFDKQSRGSQLPSPSHGLLSSRILGWKRRIHCRVALQPGETHPLKTNYCECG